MNEIFQASLGLSDVVIEEMKLSPENVFLIYVRSTKSGTNCHCCGKEIDVPYGFEPEQRIRHFTILNQLSYIVIKQPRYKCGKCNKVTTQYQSWRMRNSPHTIPFEKHILLSLINSTIEDVSAKEKIGYGAIEGILDRHLNDTIDWEKIKSINVLGIDEISLRKGHKDFATLVTSRNEQGEIRILGVLKDREKETVKKFSPNSQ